MSIDIYIRLSVERQPRKGRLIVRVTKAQAERNRAHIVATVARLFRERGYTVSVWRNWWQPPGSPMAGSTSTSAPRPT